MLQWRKRYKNRTILGFKTLAMGAVNMAMVTISAFLLDAIFFLFFFVFIFIVVVVGVGVVGVGVVGLFLYQQRRILRDSHLRIDTGVLCKMVPGGALPSPSPVSVPSACRNSH